MTDRIPVHVLAGGAIRYGVYDENGALLRYEYMKREDGAVIEGDAYNKANVLPDITAEKLGLNPAANPQIKDALAGICTVFTVVVGTTGWTSGDLYTKEVTVNGIRSADIPIADIIQSVDEADAEQERAAWSAVTKIVTGANSITITSQVPFHVDVTIRLKVVR